MYRVGLWASAARLAAELAVPVLAALAIIGLVVIGPAAPAQASCAAPVPVAEAIEAADLVFVGTVVTVAEQGRWATFEVGELWKGPRITATVEVRGGPAIGQTSVDRSYDVGTRYLVIAERAPEGDLASDYGPGAEWIDDACSATQAYTTSVDRFRPAELRGLFGSGTGQAANREPVLPDTTIEGNGIGVAILVVGATVALTYAYVSLRRQERDAVGPGSSQT